MGPGMFDALAEALVFWLIVVLLIVGGSAFFIGRCSTHYQLDVSVKQAEKP